MINVVWASSLIGDDFDGITDELDADRAWVVKQLMQHPLLKESVGGVVFGDNTPSSKAGAGELSPKPSAATDVEDPKEKQKRQEKQKEDAMVMASLAPIGMVFIRSKNGLSHVPEEFSSKKDISLGTQVLLGAILRMSQ